MYNNIINKSIDVTNSSLGKQGADACAEWSVGRGITQTITLKDLGAQLKGEKFLVLVVQIPE